MRAVLGIFLTASLLGALPAQGQRYPAPVGNCDAAVMLLEAARVANAKASAALTTAQQDKAGMCKAETLKAADARQASADRLSQRANSLLTACPGMDDAMIQGGKMAEAAKIEISRAGQARQDLVASCGATAR